MSNQLTTESGKLNKDNAVALGNGTVVSLNKGTERDRFRTTAPAAADISLSTRDELSNLIGDKLTTKLLQAIRDPNVTTEELKLNITMMQQGLPKEKQAELSRILSSIAIATVSEKLLTANFLSDIERQPGNNTSTTFIDVLKEQPLSSYEADFQKRMSTLEKYYKDLEDKKPADSKTLKAIAEAILAISVAIREYNKKAEEKKAKEEKQEQEKQTQEVAKKEQEKREKEQVKEAIYKACSAKVGTAAVIQAVEWEAKHNKEFLGDLHYTEKAMKEMKKEENRQAKARNDAVEKRRKAKKEAMEGTSVLAD